MFMMYPLLRIVFHFEGSVSQGEIGEPGQKGSKGDKGEHVSFFFLINHFTSSHFDAYLVF